MAEFAATAENFEKEVLLSAEPVLVDFWATWCGPCKMEARVIEELLAKRPSFKVAKVDVLIRKTACHKALFYIFLEHSCVVVWPIHPDTLAIKLWLENFFHN